MRFSEQKSNWSDIRDLFAILDPAQIVALLEFDVSQINCRHDLAMVELVYNLDTAILGAVSTDAWLSKNSKV